MVELLEKYENVYEGLGIKSTTISKKSSVQIDV